MIPDSKYLNSNPFSVALHFEKWKVINFFLENDLIDINSCFKKSPHATHKLETISPFDSPSFTNSMLVTYGGNSALENERPKSFSSNFFGQSNHSSQLLSDSKGFNISSNNVSLLTTLKPKQAPLRLDKEKLTLIPFEVVI